MARGPRTKKPTKATVINPLVTAEAVLKRYVQSQFGFEAAFVPQSAYVTGAADIINAVRGISDPAKKQAAAFNALRKALNATGDGGMVSNNQVAEAVREVLAAIK